MECCGLKWGHPVYCTGKHEAQNATCHGGAFPARATQLFSVAIRNHLLKSTDLLTCTFPLHSMGSLTIPTVYRSTQSVRALQGLLRNCKQTHTRVFPVQRLAPTKVWCVDRKAVISVLGKGGCSGSAHFERSCGWNEIRRAARIPCDSTGELPPTWGEFRTNRQKSWGTNGDKNCGICHTLWRSDPVLAEPDDFSKPLLLIISIFVPKPKPKLILFL